MVSIAVRHMQMVLRHSKVIQALCICQFMNFVRGEIIRQRWTFHIGVHDDSVRDDECCDNSGGQETQLENPKRDNYASEQHICFCFRTRMQR
jgi:hypothetical protein